jgi:hypothetical protein
VSETTLTVLRYYREGGIPKVEAVLWKWVRSNHDDARGAVVDPGLAARARPLPAPYDPGLTPNLWVWVSANDPAAQIPRPSEVVHGTISKPDGEVLDTVDHRHGEGSKYWNFYQLPLRSGVELLDEATWKAEMDALATVAEAGRAARSAAAAQQEQDRAAHKASARAKLAALGLTDDEVSAITGA